MEMGVVLCYVVGMMAPNLPLGFAFGPVPIARQYTIRLWRYDY
jgi:hypothetical protein